MSIHGCDVFFNPTTNVWNVFFSGRLSHWLSGSTEGGHPGGIGTIGHPSERGINFYRSQNHLGSMDVIYGHLIFPYFFPNDVEFSHLTGMASVFPTWFRRCDRCPSLDGCRSSLWLLSPSCGGMRMSSPSTATGWSERIWCRVISGHDPVFSGRVAPKWSKMTIESGGWSTWSTGFTDAFGTRRRRPAWRLGLEPHCSDELQEALPGERKESATTEISGFGIPIWKETAKDTRKTGCIDSTGQVDMGGPNGSVLPLPPTTSLRCSHINDFWSTTLTTTCPHRRWLQWINALF